MGRRCNQVILKLDGCKIHRGSPSHRRCAGWRWWCSSSKPSLWSLLSHHWLFNFISLGSEPRDRSHSTSVIIATLIMAARRWSACDRAHYLFSSISTWTHPSFPQRCTIPPIGAIFRWCNTQSLHIVEQYGLIVIFCWCNNRAIKEIFFLALFDLREALVKRIRVCIVIVSRFHSHFSSHSVVAVATNAAITVARKAIICYTSTVHLQGSADTKKVKANSWIGRDFFRDVRMKLHE